MNRALFIQKLLLPAGISALPLGWVKQYDKFYLLQTFVAGFQYYKGLNLLGELKEGDTLQLAREVENEYDKAAIALLWNGNKIGFIPARLNTVLSRVMDIQVLELHAEITHIARKAASWENISVAIYCLKERLTGGHLPIAPESLTTLITPRYFSLKTSEKIISRISEEDREEQVVVNLDRLPARYNKLREKYADKENHKRNYWAGQEDLIVLDKDDIEELLPAVREAREVADTLNRTFTQMVLDVEECLS